MICLFQLKDAIVVFLCTSRQFSVSIFTPFTIFWEVQCVTVRASSSRSWDGFSLLLPALTVPKPRPLHGLTPLQVFGMLCHQRTWGWLSISGWLVRRPVGHCGFIFIYEAKLRLLPPQHATAKTSYSQATTCHATWCLSSKSDSPHPVFVGSSNSSSYELSFQSFLGLLTFSLKEKLIWKDIGCLNFLNQN